MSLELFNYEGHQVRTVALNDEAWFVTADVALVLGLGNFRSSLALLDDDEKGVHSVDTLGGAQSMATINEAGLYSLILRSRKPEAKAFKRWVTHEVLPSIRRTGSYGTSALPQMPTHTEALRGWADTLERALEAETKVAELEPAAEAWEHLASAEGDYSLREAAQVLDRHPAIETGQNRLLKTLRTWGWVDRQGLPYQYQVGLGRLVLRTTTYDHPHTGEPKLSHQLRITPKGIEAITAKMLTGSNLLAIPGGAA